MSLLIELFWTFFKISLFSIGGGYNMIPMMQNEMSIHGWLPPERFVDILAISEATPGPIAVNLATFTGYQTAGFLGAAVATTGVCLPGALVLLLLSLAAGRLRNHPAFRAAMQGLTPILAGLLAATAIRLWLLLSPNAHLLPPLSSVLIFAATLGLLLWKKASPPLLLALAAGTGLLLSLAQGT
ncbi:MAG: chromate transporter [Verrucomicrobiota bacterium]|jgi:chromate transporter|nr:chromate transporter [Verrucomicrobiota bacterium]